MENSNSARQTGPIYENIRLLMIREAAPEPPRGFVIRAIRAVRRRVNATLMALLQSRLGLVLAALFVIALPLSVYLTADAKDPATSADPLSAFSIQPQGSFKIVYESAPPGGVTPTASETFHIRVGSFRTSSNAERVAALLRQQNFDASLHVQENGLVVVTVGPFHERADADRAVRALQQSLQLTPQVLKSGLDPR